MANITYGSGVPLQARDFRSATRRGLQALFSLMAHLKWELDEQRREYRFERALRDLDLRQLQDIGFDRDSC